MQAEVLIDEKVIGLLGHDASSGLFSFKYDPSWIDNAHAYALSPTLPLDDSGDSKERHSAQVRQFFENLLPEGQALDNASSVYQISKSNVMGLLLALGKETAGAISIRSPRAEPETNLLTLRPISYQELSERIRARGEQPFAVWDGKIRLSIAGYQDKIAVYKQHDNLFLVDGPPYASTRILKPEPVSASLKSLTSNEFFCMRLAERLKLSSAKAELIHVPEPVLLVTRFDRKEESGRIKKIHVIDGCQALGLSSAFKYERPYGSGRDVKNIRTGASFKMLTNLIDEMSPTPAAQRMQLLRWGIFQVLIGNTDAHAKNISFFCGTEGLEIAPAYDLTCGLAFKSDRVDDTLAMAIGDAFKVEDITPFEWANFAHQCRIPKRLLTKVLKDMATSMMNETEKVLRQCISEEAEKTHLEAIAKIVLSESDRQLDMADKIKHVPDDFFNE